MMWPCYDDLTSNVCGCRSLAQHLVGRRCNWFLAVRRKHYVQGSLGINICPRIIFCTVLQVPPRKPCVWTVPLLVWMKDLKFGTDLTPRLPVPKMAASACADQKVSVCPEPRGLMSRWGGWNPPRGFDDFAKGAIRNSLFQHISSHFFNFTCI